MREAAIGLAVVCAAMATFAVAWESPTADPTSTDIHSASKLISTKRPTTTAWPERRTLGKRVEAAAGAAADPEIGLSRVRVHVRSAFGESEAHTVVHLAGANESHRQRITGRDGAVLFRDVTPGETVASIRGASQTIFALPGRTHSVTLNVPETRRVIGRVLDPSGRPVADAEVCGLNQKTALARTGSNGEFVIPAVFAFQRIYAAAQGFAPSRSSRAVAADSELLELQLEECATSLQITVIGPGKQPIAGADVTVQCGGVRMIKGTSGWLRPVAVRRRTDERGRLARLSVASGPCQIVVDPPAPYQRSIHDCNVGSATKELELSCTLGGLLSGTLTTASGGQPAAHARVTVLPTDNGDPVVVHADHNGRFTMCGAPIGRRLNETMTGVERGVKVTAEHPRFGRVTEFVRLDAGRSASVALQLDPADVISGRFDQVPDGLTLDVVTDSENGMSTVHSDGRFWCLPAPDTTTVELRARVPGRSFPAAVRSDIAPGTSHLRLSIQPWNPGVATGRLVSGGAPVRAGIVTLIAEDSSAKVRASIMANGAFTLPGVPPGAYWLVFQWPHAPEVVRLGAQRIRSGSLNLGELAIPPSAYGRISLHCDPQDDSRAQLTCSIQTWPDATETAESTFVGRHRMEWALPAADYEIRISRNRRQPQLIRVRVDPGRTVQVAWSPRGMKLQDPRHASAPGNQNTDSRGRTQ